MGTRYSAQIYVLLKNPRSYTSEICQLVDKFWPLCEKVTSKLLESEQRLFAYFLLSNAFEWEGWYADKKTAECIIASVKPVECNANISEFKLNTKFTHTLGQIFKTGKNLEMLCKSDELKGEKSEGKHLGFGFKTDIWNNNLPEITREDIEQYANKLPETVKKYPEAAEIIDVCLS
jgi:hypothetical protein